jgi:hypothetical protein
MLRSKGGSRKPRAGRRSDGREAIYLTALFIDAGALLRRCACLGIAPAINMLTAVKV